MAKPYDAATKRLLELRPADWVAYLGLPPGKVILLDTDLSTISLAADRLVQVEAPSPYILHTEFESGKDTSGMPFRLLQYNVNAQAKYRLTILSSVVLLHKGADSPQITGELRLTGPDGNDYLTFQYRAIRIWQQDVEALLTGGLGLLPFAPIANTTEGQLPGIIERMEQRIESEAASDSEAGELWTAAYILLGLRYNKTFYTQLLQGVRHMKESATYQAIVEEGRLEGRVEGEFRALLRVGTKRFGEPSDSVRASLEAIDSAERLESLLDRVMEVESWDELIL